MAVSDMEVRVAAFAMGAAYAMMAFGFFRPAWKRHRDEAAPARSRGEVPGIVDRLWVATHGWTLLLLFFAFAWPPALGWSPFSLLGLASIPTLVAGASIFAAGCALVAWASKHLGAELALAIEAREGGRLVTSGPYSRVRHPIYTGVFLLVAGEAMALGAPLLAVYGVVAVLCANLRAGAEEAMLEGDPVHGAAYRTYKSKTGRFVPVLRARRLQTAGR